MVSLSMLAVAAAGLGLIRWRLADGTPPDRTMATDESHLVDTLRDDLASRYRARDGWGFLPADAGERSRWLLGRASVLASVTAPSDTGALASPTLGFRLVLSDAQGHVLAGRVPSRVLVALASIDRARTPVMVDGRTVGYLTVAVPHDARDALVVAFLIQQQRPLALLALIAAVLGALAAAIVATGFRRPIDALVRGARRLGSGRYDTRVVARHRDELGELADTFNQLAEKLAITEQERRQWVADTSHELRTPLAVLRAQIEALQDGIRPLDRESLTLLRAQTGTLARLVDDLHALAAADLGERGYDRHPLDLRELIVPVWQGFAGRFADRQLSTAMTGFDTPMVVLADAERLRQLISNLLENARRHTDAGGQVRLSGEVGRDALRIVIEDSAPGVPGPLLGRLGERFFRVDPSRSRAAGGAGFGLALSRGIAEAHGGSLTFAPSPLGGLRVVLTLPGVR